MSRWQITWLLEPAGDGIVVPSFSPDMTIRQILPQIDTTGFATAKELQLPGSVDKDTPLAKLEIEQEQLDEVTTHLLSHRGGLFVLMLLMLFGLVGGTKGFVVHHFINPFNLFAFRFETPTILLTVILALGLASVTSRPFCRFICPFRFVSWLAERFSFVRVRVNRDRCSGCAACSLACPLQSAKHIVEGKFFGADCYSCARCLRVCPEDAIIYRSVRLSEEKEFQAALETVRKRYGRAMKRLAE